jgi:O-antigen/teichoic acid export membrane protein
MSLRKQFIENTSMMVIIRLTRGISLFISNLILARLLFPYDFGMAGLALSIITIITQLSDIGLEKAVIQKNSLDNNILITGATLRLLISIIFTITVIIISPLFSYVYNNTNIVLIIQVCSILFIIQSAGFIPLSIINIKLQFKKLIIPSVGSSLTILITSIIFALLHYGYWSIILSNILGGVANVIILWILNPWHLILKIDKTIMKQLINYGKYATIIALLSAIVMNADRFISATFLKIDSVGFYTIAYTWGTFFVFNISYIIAGITFPSFSAQKNDLHTLRLSFLSGIKYLHIISLPIVALMIFFSSEFITFFLGPVWLPANFTFKLILFYSLFYIEYFLHYDLFFALNQLKRLLLIHIIIIIIQLTTIYPLGRLYNISGIAITLIISFGIGIILELKYSMSILKYKLIDLKEYLAPQIISTLLASLSLLILPLIFHYSIISNILITIIFLMIYLISLKLIGSHQFWEDITKTVHMTKSMIIYNKKSVINEYKKL